MTNLLRRFFLLLLLLAGRNLTMLETIVDNLGPSAGVLGVASLRVGEVILIVFLSPLEANLITLF